MPSAAQARSALQRLSVQLAAITGTQTDRMTRDHGWRLLSVGRSIERLSALSASLAGLLEAFDTAGGATAATELLLDLFDSRITFRARYQRHEDLLALADLLVFDDSNPRAFSGCLRRLRTEIAKLPGPADTHAAFTALLPAEGAGVSPAAMAELDDAALREALMSVSTDLEQRAWKLSDAIGQRYFAHTDSAALQRV